MISHKKIVVTGGAGFIGSHLVDALAKPEDKNTVIIIDDLSTGKRENIQHHLKNKQNNNVEFIKGSITDLLLLKETFKDVDYVFHEASIASVPKSIEDPVKTNEVNVNGTLNVQFAVPYFCPVCRAFHFQ